MIAEPDCLASRQNNGASVAAVSFADAAESGLFQQPLIAEGAIVCRWASAPRGLRAPCRSALRFYGGEDFCGPGV